MIYHFSVQEILNADNRSILKDKSGIYLAKNYENKIVYIGKSDNLFIRMNLIYHHKLKHHLKEIKEMIISVIDKKVIEIKNEHMGIEYVARPINLDYFERRLIRNYQPILNNSQTNKERRRLEEQGKKMRTPYVILKDGIVVKIYNSITEMRYAFNMNTTIGRKNWLEGVYNKLSSSDLNKMMKGEIIDGFQAVKLFG